jgi:hypothetical protein
LIIPAHRHSRVGEMVNIMANGLKVLDLGCVLKGFKWLEKVTLNCLNMRHSEPDHRATLACKETCHIIRLTAPYRKLSPLGKPHRSNSH